MTCDERRDTVFLYAAGELEPSEREVVRAHLLSGCPRCSGTLAEAEAVLASIPLALEPVTPGAATKDKLMARVRASSQTDAAAASTMKLTGGTPPPSRGRFTLGSLVTYSGIAAAIAAIIAGVAVKQNLQPKIEQLTSVRDILLAERMQMVSLADPANAAPATGRVYWDMDKGMWGVVVFNLKPPPAGKVYQLWAIPDGTGAAPMPMNTFTVNATGKAMFTQPVPAASTPIKLAAITMEPEGGSKTPTMPIQLMGAAK
jgi:hypothetical protein